MRTTIDLPDDLLRAAEIKAVERGASLRQFVIDALQHEMAGAVSTRKRLVRPPLKLSAEAPLRHLTTTAVKAIDAEDQQQADEHTARAGHR